MNSIRTGAVAVVSAATMIGGQASAALPPHVYVAARANAPHHLQVAVARVRVEPGICVIEGRAGAVFRGDLAAGAPVQFSVSCLTPDIQPAPGPEIWFDPAALSAAKVVEGFFGGDAPDLQPARGQVGVVPAARDRPWCASDALTCELP